MSTLQQVDEGTILSVPTDGRAIEDLLAGEWLLTNGRGGYASSTIAGCNTRAYHGILVGSLRPPTNRVMALSNFLEMIISNGRVCNLSTFEFADKFAPAGYGLLRRFRQDIGVHYDYETENVELTKSVYLLRNTDAAVIVYEFVGVRESVEFVSRPFIGLRDFHTLQKSYATMSSRWIGSQSGGLLVRYETPGSCELLLKCTAATFVKDKQWWFNFVYRRDRERGQAFTEDLWTPGFFKCRIDSPTKIVVTARLADCTDRIANKAETEPCDPGSVDKLRKELWRHQEGLKRKARAVKHDLQFPITDHRLKNSNLDSANSRLFETLCLAADAFVAERQTQTSRRTTILAGYPWFADWGRDAFISLPGLLLATGRFDEAKSVLTTFATVADMGMIPNRFDDRSETAHFNSVDASLWFINAAFQYLDACNDSDTFVKQLLPTIQWIVDSYKKGTRFGIRADDDGLITAGDERTQLTWMDAKYDGIAFTPRFGKAVEINALWYNSLMQIGNLESENNDSAYYESMADKVRASFRELFWNEQKGYLNDCIVPDGSADESLRPNQIFAVSLEFSPLPPEQQKSVVNAVQSQLLTPYGLRTLDPQAENYRGRYEGSPYDRDAAYHQGTAWPYLIGAFVQAYLKVNEFSPKSKTKAAEFILPLLGHLTETGLLGSIAEIFDGDDPQKPKGCFAQAWSVAELIRAYKLVTN
ncbi:MAG: glycogen debranching enzyme family protein [Phycisphaerales bacterium]|nr:MAG: glycogen debranching enzyme family protein [Phycisphaerales bacterium]